MNLKFVWSELHLISVRSQNELAFATAVEAFVNTARGFFNANSLFIFLAFDARALKNCIANTVVAKQNALALQAHHDLPFCIVLKSIVLKNKINTYNYLQKRKKIGFPRRDRLRVFESSGNLNRISSSPVCDRLSLQYVLKRKGKKTKKHQAFYEIICIVDYDLENFTLE